ncbi:activating signal cointegrator 1 complex subunit 2 homolog [Plodia interpunctella]|uniref:activating signal cointegrator 1 complex subunit 2 homolog n=1 Tax=Plodia interpunctella TaxID=58824 RepID=UPI00236755D9|nr:activating signal cointegrator 1 complex subunit 2 homolog [Plodia interpunctella]
MFVLKIFIFCSAWLTISCQNGPTTTPVPILKQINRQNDDGSYSYGYEAADGSFKIETKYPNGDVAGKYGYVDENGKTREISYGASSKRGFEPQGAGIVVPPPSLNENPTNALADGQEDDGQYREDPKIYEDPKYNGRAQSRPSFKQFLQPSQPTAQPEPQYQRYQSQPSQFRSAPLYTQQTNTYNQSPQQFPQERPQSQIFHQQPQFSYQAYTAQPYNQYQNQYQNQPQYQSQNYQQNFNPFVGHPAQNFDPNTGSYTINFTG